MILVSIATTTFGLFYFRTLSLTSTVMPWSIRDSVTIHAPWISAVTGKSQPLRLVCKLYRSDALPSPNPQWKITELICICISSWY